MNPSRKGTKIANKINIYFHSSLKKMQSNLKQTQNSIYMFWCQTLL